jgi:hypothetical protein
LLPLRSFRERRAELSARDACCQAFKLDNDVRSCLPAIAEEIGQRLDKAAGL